MESAICTQQQLLSSELQMWAKLFNQPGVLHRKAWEWCFIAQALQEHGVLMTGEVGLGFGVGGEPLTGIFAALGAGIVATDLDIGDAVKAGWTDGAQHAASKANLNAFGLCPFEKFDQLVHFENCNMNEIPSEFNGKFDFVWSSNALGHLGSIENGKKFIYRSLDCLKEGGIAVHTTEFNVSSNEETVTSGPTVLFRRKDIQDIIGGVFQRGCRTHMNWDCGSMPKDYYLDVPPYRVDPHLKIRIDEYTVTSLGLVIVKDFSPQI